MCICTVIHIYTYGTHGSPWSPWVHVESGGIHGPPMTLPRAVGALPVSLPPSVIGGAHAIGRAHSRLEAACLHRPRRAQKQKHKNTKNKNNTNQKIKTKHKNNKQTTTQHSKQQTTKHKHRNKKHKTNINNKQH